MRLTLASVAHSAAMTKKATMPHSSRLDAVRGLIRESKAKGLARPVPAAG